MSKKSIAEHGTVLQIRNLIGRSNVVGKPKKDMNACKYFLILLLHSYITSAAMNVLEITSLEEWPSSVPENIWLESNEE